MFLKGLASATDHELENSSEACERRALRSAFLVLAGLIAEVAIAWFHPSPESLWERWGSVVADILVAVGVGGEVLFGRMGHKRDAELQRRSKQKVAEANARAAAAHAKAAEAELELEKLKTPRSISAELRDRIVEKMKPFAPQQYTGRVSAGSNDGWGLWGQISLALELAGWQRVGPFDQIGHPPYGPPASVASGAMAGLMIWFPAAGTLENTRKCSSAASALAAAIRDDGEGVLAAPGHGGSSHQWLTIEIGPDPHLPASAYHGPDPAY